VKTIIFDVEKYYGKVNSNSYEDYRQTLEQIKRMQQIILMIIAHIPELAQDHI
jgi:hypothetical protein